jgi:hypothetical protein
MVSDRHLIPQSLASVWLDGRLMYSHSHGFRLLGNRCGAMGVRSGHLEAGRPVHFWVLASRDFKWIREW